MLNILEKIAIVYSLITLFVIIGLEPAQQQIPPPLPEVIQFVWMILFLMVGEEP